ncbi:MAG: M56 family metallopeptidase [Terracidiphilus sp.]|jgi:beta-lactamase regulating signal transducer with metallopeptidase domain
MILSLIPILIEAALRAIVVALAVWAGLRLVRVRNVVAQKAAWCMVLAGSLLIPLLMHWQVVTARATVKLPASKLFQADSRIARALTAFSAHGAVAPAAAVPPASRGVVQGNSVADRSLAPSALKPGSDSQQSAALEIAPISSQIAAKSQPATQTEEGSFPGPVALGCLLYLAVCLALLTRLFLGLGSAIRLWLHAELVSIAPHFAPAAGLRVRSSPLVDSPVTIGSGVVLPADWPEWDEEKLRITLAHERSHIRQGDFYLQILAGLYASLFWFSPLGWWLKRKLSELAEAISDRAGVEEATSRFSYAQILLEFAALPRPTFVGVAMARSSNLSHRIERLLNESSFRRAFAGSSRRALMAVLVVPLALLAATALVRVEAASATSANHPGQFALQEPVNDTFNGERVALNTEPPAPALVAEASLASAPASASEATFERTLSINGRLELSVATGSGNIHLAHGGGNSLHIIGRVKSNSEGGEEQVRAIAANPPIEQNGNVVRIGVRHENLHNISIDYEIEAPANALLDASSGSGDITDDGVGENAKLSTGSGNIHATGLHGGFLADTGSGNVYIEQTGEGDVKAETGSGNVELKGVQGALRAVTGSGDIKLNGTPAKDWKVETGSGNIEYWSGNAPLTLDASTGSGDIHTDSQMLVQSSSDHRRLSGKLNGGGPTVRLETGSGDIRVH